MEKQIDLSSASDGDAIQCSAACDRAQDMASRPGGQCEPAGKDARARPAAADTRALSQLSDEAIRSSQTVFGAVPDECDSPSEVEASSGHNLDLGRRGEQAAARFLERRGMEILERNWVCAAGEADIIAYDGEAIHFVEVKTRSNVAHGFPSEAVTSEKRGRYERIASIYLSRSKYVDVSVLFDIISIVVTGPDRAFLRFHRNAFASCD